MTTSTAGLHHVTAISGDAQRNADFYTRVLGLRLVKRTVNFDDPKTYHLYYGDEGGTPGSLMTFFPWAGASRGRAGVGSIGTTGLAIPPASLGWWLERLVKHGVAHRGPVSRFDERVISFDDPDGMHLELVAHPSAEGRPLWGGGPVPAQHAIHGVHNVTLWVADKAPTGGVLTDVLGFRELSSAGSTTRFVVGDGGAARIVDVRAVGGFLGAATGPGSVHHVAFRAADQAAQLAVSDVVRGAGLRVTPVQDRQYFESIYFHEPGGVLFEVATDGPGFAIDEPLAQLGEALKLPPQYESHRAEIERALPPLVVGEPLHPYEAEAT
ncbi:MAG: ring-cleaving dioxygenase [Gemmatimonadetes bacterium]|nr:ring-cleaving dioxygenase [Gemmatimonadota bacterium]